MEDKTVIQPSVSSGSVRRGVRLNGVYELGALIAHGGMGEVYRGFNIVTNDPVAIKMILPELSSNPDAFAMFRREASTLLNLQHEAIVRYFVFSVDPGLQRAYLAMEFVDGPSLGKRLRNGPLAIEEVRILQHRLAGALDAAHRLGIVHRDISSDNIILPDGDPRRAKVIDFGIARSQRLGEGTIIGDGFAGKYNYVSPEQLGLGGGEVTSKSDIYSLGLVLAEALRGRPIDMSGTQVEIIEKRRKVPDLSDVDPSLRPLLTAMLQPLPADRPESMAAVAAWTPPAARGRLGGGPPRTNAKRDAGSSSLGRAAAIAGALILVGSLGGTLYVLRDDLPWRGSAPAIDGGGSTAKPEADAKPEVKPEAKTETKPAASEASPDSGPPPPHKLPPLPEVGTNETGPPSAAPATGGSTPPGGPAPAAATSTTPHVPNADEILESLNRAKAQSKPPDVVASNGPSKVDATSASAAIKEPAKSANPPAAGLDAAKAAEPPPVVRPPATTPHAPQGALTLGDAIVGRDYAADLPPFSDAAGAKALALHVEPNPPEGLTFADLGSGFGQISGRPAKPGQYSFDVVAANATGESARMTAKIAVAPPPAPIQKPPVHPPEPQQPEHPQAEPKQPDPLVASASPGDKTANFLRGFDGGSCFLVRSLGGGGAQPAILGVGADEAAFERFDEAFKREVGVEPDVILRLIARPQCPAVNLIGAVANSADAPKIQLNNYEVGHSKPLAGSVSNVAGRAVTLLLVSNDGDVEKLLEARPTAGSVSFSLPLTADAQSINAPQVVIAVLSNDPPRALAGFKGGPAADILPRLQSELAEDGGVVGAEYFKLVK